MAHLFNMPFSNINTTADNVTYHYLNIIFTVFFFMTDKGKISGSSTYCRITESRHQTYKWKVNNLLFSVSFVIIKLVYLKI